MYDIVSISTLDETPANKASNAYELLETTPAAGEQAKLAFGFLCVFTFVGFGRPEDLFQGLGSLHLTAISAVLALVAYMGALLAGRARFLWSTNLLLVLLLTGWFIVGLPFACYRGGSFEVLTQTWLRTLVFFFLLTQTLTTVARVRTIIWMVVLAELIVSLASILLQGQAGLQEGERLAGVSWGLLGWNFLGITFSVTLPLIAALYVSRRSILGTTVLAVTLGVTIWMIVLTASRGGFLGIVISFVLTGWFVLRNAARGRALTLLLPLLLAIVLVKAPAVFWSRLQTMWSDSSTTTSYLSSSASMNREAVSAEESTKGREALLENSVKYSIEFPVFGLGLGNFPLYNGGTLHRSDAWLGTHNTFTQISSEAGIPALVLFVCLLLTILNRMRKIRASLCEDEKHIELRSLVSAAFASALMFALQGFFAHIAYDYLFYFIAGIAAGLWTIHHQNSQEGQPANLYDETIASTIWSKI